MSVERAPTEDQILILRCVDSAGAQDARAINNRCLRRGLELTDIHAALRRLIARGYLYKEGWPVAYRLTQKGQRQLDKNDS
jgi:hypothetical protein